MVDVDSAPILPYLIQIDRFTFVRVIRRSKGEMYVMDYSVNPNPDKHMSAIARAISKEQGGAYLAGGKGSMKEETFDKNRGSDKGGSNAPTQVNG